MNTQEIETNVSEEEKSAVLKKFCGRVLGSKEEALAAIAAVRAVGGNASALRKFGGCLENSPNFKGDSMEIQRKLRRGWG